MRLKIIFIITLLFAGLAWGQNKFEAGVLLGWYQPELTGLDTSLEAGAGNDFFRQNALLGYSISFPLFPSARLGFARGGSYYSGEDDTTSFSRKIIYRQFKVETYFRPWRRLELNFGLAPMYNTAVINLDIKNKSSVWDAQIGNYQLGVSAPEKMVNRFFGFSGTLGVRYYLLSWLAFDFKAGFMKSTFNSNNWKLDGKNITGPDLDINDEPLFIGQMVFAW